MTHSQTPQLNFLFSLHAFGIKLGLDKSIQFFTSLGIYPVNSKIIHIAGTNGKGSTASYLNSILIEYGFKVGLYTSPHILDFRERIKINNEMIPLSYVINFIDINKDQIESEKLTFFEATTGLALHYFKEKKCDFIILETGMGGRLDSTNCFSPIATIITNVSLDHQEYLGDTIEKIALEKSGIIKNNCSLFCSEAQPEISLLIKIEADKKSAPFINCLDADLTIDPFLNDNPLPLEGAHQKQNAKTALICLKNIFKKLNYPLIKKAWSKLYWPARLEIWQENRRVILDVSHNLDGITKSIDTLKEKADSYILLCAFLQDKDIQANLAACQSLTSDIYIYNFEHPRYNLKKLITAADNLNIEAELFEQDQHYLDLLKKHPEKKLLVIGSFYLIEDFLKRFSKNLP